MGAALRACYSIVIGVGFLSHRHVDHGLIHAGGRWVVSRVGAEAETQMRIGVRGEGCQAGARYLPASPMPGWEKVDHYVPAARGVKTWCAVHVEGEWIGSSS